MTAALGRTTPAPVPLPTPAPTPLLFEVLGAARWHSPPVPVPAGTASYQLDFSGYDGSSTGLVRLAESYDGGLSFPIVVLSTAVPASARASVPAGHLPGFVEVTADNAHSFGYGFSVTLSFFDSTGHYLGG